LDGLKVIEFPEVSNSDHVCFHDTVTFIVTRQQLVPVPGPVCIADSGIIVKPLNSIVPVVVISVLPEFTEPEGCRVFMTLFENVRNFFVKA